MNVSFRPAPCGLRSQPPDTTLHPRMHESFKCIRSVALCFPFVSPFAAACALGVACEQRPPGPRPEFYPETFTAWAPTVLSREPRPCTQTLSSLLPHESRGRRPGQAHESPCAPRAAPHSQPAALSPSGYPLTGAAQGGFCPSGPLGTDHSLGSSPQMGLQPLRPPGQGPDARRGPQSWTEGEGPIMSPRF